ncbi:NAD(P)/FAD-dependent oxidoreductase [Dokdonia donghaensis]|uniref:Amino acid dehydrogenase n=1 Tax=Dokdonia donghaensis DSW-1 TaxID=1300343 RepID=A0A0A2H223_9FLAO|nr:FAD-dependent oxidoreductase [Dokdonia donghaensis]ANH59290.1 D-amino acid dehydrogenase small subunit [Dokdonia donghaensis DSW-1]KGO06695.1 amino acid dehydrogenase [Dokdonia donghaensis DSW-1]
MAKHIIIIGGGIVGVSCAYFLHKAGHQVTIIDQSKMSDGASYVNAGYMSPSHLIPLAAPGVMKQGVKWMFNKKSPLYIKPRLNADFLKWSLAFNRSCNQNHVHRSIPVMRDMAVMGRDLYHQIKKEEGFSFHIEKKGLLMLCQTEKALHHEDELVQIASKEGLQAKTITAQEVQKMMPETALDVVGASYFECDHHSTPGEFMEEIKSYLLREGVVIRQKEKVLDITTAGSKVISLHTDKEVLTADEFVLAAGSWTSTLSRKLNINLLLQAGKGYRIQTKTPTGITYPAILAEAKVAITPMNGFTRFAGTMEIAGINHTINKTRVEAIAQGVNKYFPKVRITSQEKEAAACGLRPVSADGMPYIGKSAKCDNLTIATGHAMMGWTLGPSTGKLVQEIIDNKTSSVTLDMLHPDRKF